MTFAELKTLAEAVPRYEKEALLALTDRAQGGDGDALDELTLALLPQFTTAYTHEMGCIPEKQALLEDCLARYREALKTFDFRQTGESFSHRLCWHLRQARADDIATSVHSVPVSLKEIEAMRRKKEE